MRHRSRGQGCRRDGKPCVPSTCLLQRSLRHSSPTPAWADDGVSRTSTRRSRLPRVPHVFAGRHPRARVQHIRGREAPCTRENHKGAFSLLGHTAARISADHGPARGKLLKRVSQVRILPGAHSTVSGMTRPVNGAVQEGSYAVITPATRCSSHRGEGHGHVVHRAVDTVSARSKPQWPSRRGFYAGMGSEEAGPVTRSTSLVPPVRPLEDRSKAPGPSSRGSTSVGRSRTPSRSRPARTARVSASGRT